MSGETNFSLESILEEERLARAQEPKTEELTEEPAAEVQPEILPDVQPEPEAQPEVLPEAEGNTQIVEIPDLPIPEPAPIAESPEEDRRRAMEISAAVEEALAESGMQAPAEAAKPAQAPVQGNAPLQYIIPDMSKKKKEKKERKGFFARRREKKQKQEEFNASEDMYYGIQLKPIDEYTRGFDQTGEISLEQDGYKKLFDENTKELDDEVAKDFERLQQERRRRVAEAVENAGVNVDEVENELGIVAPIPISAFAGDPYAKQHGIEDGTVDENLPDFQKVMIQDAQTRTMELTLNPDSDHVGLQQVKVMPEVQEEELRGVLETVQEEEAEQAVTDPAFTDVSSFSEEKIAEMDAAKSSLPQVVDFAEAKAEMEAQAGPQDMQAEAQAEPVRVSLPVSDVTEYRKRDLPVHIINADVLQSALLSEARIYSEEETEAENGRMRLRLRKPAEETEEEEYTGEMLDDFTSPADVKSISHDLKTTMRQLTVRLLGTGLSCAVLILAAFICEAGFTPGNTVLNGAIGYAVVSLIFLLVAVGFCGKVIRNGLSSLLELRPNSDSAASVAVLAAFIQTLSVFFYIDTLAAGQIHLYAGIAAGILFLNTLGKLTMVRRIYSNFRFVASREDKYAVRLVEDHNAALKLTGSTVVSNPAVAYQQKADFLKRFLQISYEPDPAETASQALAPVSLIASLLLCVIALLVTGDPALSLTAFAAACCVSTAVMNMVAVNLPIGRLSQRLRRAGAMVSGYEGIRRMSAVNAVLVDAAELFPRGTVVLNGVKPFAEENLEDAILAAGAMMQTVGGPLCSVFEQVLNEFEGELPEVTEARYDEKGGVIGTVDGHKVLFGSHALLHSFGISTPGQMEEQKYTNRNRQVLYVAMDGVLCAMFILTYNADRKKRADIRELEMNGVAMVVRSADVNLTPQFLGTLFGVDPSGIQVIPNGADTFCDTLFTETAGRVDAYVATKGRAESMMRVISSSIDEKKNIGFIVAMQNASVVIGFVLVAFLTFISGVKQISTLALVIYELFWVAAAVFLPKLKNKFNK